MRPDFETCASDFLNNSAGIYSKYLYNGSVQGVLSTARPALITVHGCKELCGTGVDYYPWTDSSTTITTWILPIAGLLVQAPYESNKAWQTILALSRWVGSPISTLSYILWNIKVTGKCALMIDMATKYDEYPAQGSDFSLMRDSLYILCIMNQYSAKQSLPPVEAERLLRLALFSNLLPLNGSSDGRALVKRRTELAQNFREGRECAFCVMYNPCQHVKHRVFVSRLCRDGRYASCLVQAGILTQMAQERKESSQSSCRSCGSCSHWP